MTLKNGDEIETKQGVSRMGIFEYQKEQVMPERYNSGKLLIAQIVRLIASIHTD